MDFVEHIRRESRLYRNAVSRCEPGARVPSCPDWDALDLLWHLTEVQWFWGAIVEERLTEPDSADGAKPDRPDGLEPGLDLFDEASERLARALEGTPPDTPVWTWHPLDQTAGFIRRRQAHEALIHRVDAEQAAGIDISSIDPALAADGVDEILTVMIGGVPDWATFTPDGQTMQLRTVMPERRWRIAFGRMTGTSPNTGNTYDLDAAAIGEGLGPSDTTISGDPVALDLWLWGRDSIDPLAVEGDAALVDRLRELAVAETQ